LLEAELVQYVQPLQVVQVEVGEEEIDWQVILNIAIGLVNAISCIQYDVVFFRVDQSADGIACVCIIPAIGAEEDDLHILAKLLMIRGYKSNFLEYYCGRSQQHKFIPEAIFKDLIAC
jgi:hypothetical protein